MIVPRPWPSPGIGLRSVSRDPRIRGVVALARHASGPAPAQGAPHAELVALYARRIGSAMGLSPAHCARLELCGLVHDVGKAALPQELLSKPGPLTEREFTLMARHPELGATMLASPDLADVRMWTLCHHERVDGYGYPAGLMGADIPLEARIMAVADAYAAMIEVRPYRPALSLRQAREELAAGAGTQFDADVVSVFLRTLGVTRRALGA